ncbi:MAG: hypothetical protein ACRD5H_03330, partial [Nitrososphaerales archaeon]
INSKLDAITAKNDTQIIVLDNSQYVAKLASMLVESLMKNGASFSICVPSDAFNAYRNTYQDKGIRVTELPDDPSKLSSNPVFVSQTSFDPLFGYSGSPTRLLRHFGKEEMFEAYKARNGDVPSPGKADGALSIADKFVERFDGTSIEAIIGTHGFADIVIDKPAKAHQTAIAKLESFGRVEVEKAKASIISSGNGRSTLSNALNSLWNCVDAVKEDGSITLLAECSDGFGSSALERLVEGKIEIEDAHNLAEYIDGLENLLYLDGVSEKYELALISTLPDYYAKNRLGFKTFRRIKDALHHVLNVHGQRQKVLVVSDASKVLLKPKS